jgi:hypothetical protein
MGPIFAAFGRYLSSRIDVVPEGLGDELSRIEDAAGSSSAANVREMFTRELDCPPEHAFARFDPDAFRSLLLWQAHHARLGNANVIVKFIHPEIERQLGDVELLPLLEGSFSACGLGTQAWRGALADFQAWLTLETTFDANLEGARLLTQDAQIFDLLGAHRVYTHLSTRHVAVYERWQDLGGAPAPDLARALCTVWLRQSLQGSVFPVNPTRENTGLVPDGRIVFPSGTFATLPDALKASLWNYFVAVASENPDGAATHLASALGIRAMTPACENLQRRIRQMVPFRDGFRERRPGGGWPAEGQRFSEELLIHWRIANEKGLMSGNLLSFYRGLFTIVRTTRPLAPGRDSLAEAFRDLRLLNAFGQFRDLIQPSQMASLMENYAESFVATPERLDRFLTNVTSGALPWGAGRAMEPHRDRAENRHVRIACLSVAMVSVGVVLHRITPSFGHGAHAITALLFLALGLVVLRAIAR